MKVSSLAEIREQLARHHQGIEQKEYWHSKTVPGGIPRGILLEVCGTARTEWVSDFLQDNNSLQVFWAEPKLSLLPTALLQRGVDLSKVLMVETGEHLFPSIRKALKTKLFNCVVLPGTIHDVRMLKALQLFSRESQALVCFLSRQRQISWSIPLQIEARWERGRKTYTTEILKSKFYASESS